MIALTAQLGYQEVSVAQVSSHAGVSSSTFYEQFKDREHCLLAAYHAAAAHLVSELQTLGRDSRGWEDAVGGSLGSILAALQENGAAARVVLIESRGAGPVLSQERERALSGFEAQLERYFDTIAGRERTLDIPALALLGGTRAAIVRCLRAHSEDRLTLLEDDLIAWMGSYAVPAGTERWSTSPGALAPARRERRGSAPAGSPTPIPRGRHSLPPSVVMRSQRLRLINGTAEVMAAKGYAAATVADIVSAAGVSRDVFYAQFTDKQHVFLEAQQMGSQDIQDACAAAYFSAQQWPERIWRCLGTLIEVIAQNRPLAHLRLVECYSAGPPRSIEPRTSPARSRSSSRRDTAIGQGANVCHACAPRRSRARSSRSSNATWPPRTSRVCVARCRSWPTSLWRRLLDPHAPPSGWRGWRADNSDRSLTDRPREDRPPHRFETRRP